MRNSHNRKRLYIIFIMEVLNAECAADHPSGIVLYTQLLRDVLIKFGSAHAILKPFGKDIQY